MAVRGLELFSERFADYRDAFILIGGAACDLWFSDQNLAFRATRDLDIVLILERLTPEFIDQFRAFVEEGGYNEQQRNDVFRLAITLPGEPGDTLPEELAHDVASFLISFPPENEDWEAIQQAIRPTAGGPIASETLIEAVRTYYQLGEERR